MREITCCQFFCILGEQYTGYLNCNGYLPVSRNVAHHYASRVS